MYLINLDQPLNMEGQVASKSNKSPSVFLKQNALRKVKMVQSLLIYMNQKKLNNIIVILHLATNSITRMTVELTIK